MFAGISLLLLEIQRAAYIDNDNYCIHNIIIIIITCRIELGSASFNLVQRV